MKQIHSLAMTAILLLACLPTAAVAQLPPTPEETIAVLEQLLKQCWEKEEDMNMEINNLQILIKISGDTQFASIYSARYIRLLHECTANCEVILHLYDQVDKERERPKPSPSPRPSPQPSPQPSPTPSEQEPREKLVKELKEYEKQTTVVREEFTRLIEEIHAAVRKIKLARGGKPRGYEGVPETRSGGGLRTSIFSLPEGQLRINLSQDIRAGDTISGTVVAEPNGKTEDERARNLAELTLYQLDVRSLNTPEAIAGFTYPLLLSARTNRFTLTLPPTFPGSSGSQPAIDCTLTAPEGNELTRISIPLESGSPAAATNTGSSNFQLSTIGQQGRNNLIRGKFDGNAANTYLRLGGRFLRPLVESPRQCIFESPSDATGMNELEVGDGGSRSRGKFRNLGLQLSAPKTSLVKGESTVVTIIVSGLKGIERPVPLLLEKGGVVSMEGGDTQTVQIRPDNEEVKTKGTFTVKRKLTGEQSGVFEVMATVIDPERKPIEIALKEGARVNGFHVKADGQLFNFVATNVVDPVTGKPVDGEHKLEYRCPQLSRVPYINRIFLNKGMGKMKAECLIIITPRIIIQDEN